MSSILTAIIPIFGLIALGAAAGYWRLLSADSGKALSEFIFRLAIPALLFRTMLKADLSGTAFLGLWATQFGTVVIGWILAAVATTRVLGRPASDGAAIAMSTTHGNLLLLGLPVALSAFGPNAAPSVAVLLSLHSPVLWFLGTVHIAATASEGETDVGKVARSLLLELGRNPVILALVAGTVARFTGLNPPPTIDRLLEMLAQASVPCALVALGLSLCHFQIKGEQSTVALLLGMKLLLMPLIAWLLATRVFELQPIQIAVAVLFAAMPAGANAFLFADRHQRAVGSTSAAVAVGTVLSFATLTFVIYALAPA